MTKNDVPGTAAEWFSTPLGRYLLARELPYFDRIVADIFGYNAFQFGLPDADLLRSSRIALRMRLDPHGPANLRADFRDLPIASSSVDLVLLPHVLEFSDNPHHVLSEVARILMPEGQVVITCFNPWSLWGFRRLFHRDGHYPWNGRFINLPRLKDWCALLGLEIDAGEMGCYVPPCRTEKWLKRFAFMDAAGDRWWPIAGGVYALKAVKRVRGLHLIMPKWKDQLAPKKELAPVPKKVRQPEEAVVARNGVTDRTRLIGRD